MHLSEPSEPKQSRFKLLLAPEHLHHPEATTVLQRAMDDWSIRFCGELLVKHVVVPPCIA
jgi:hypothetical protein